MGYGGNVVGRDSKHEQPPIDTFRRLLKHEVETGRGQETCRALTKAPKLQQCTHKHNSSRSCQCLVVPRRKFGKDSRSLATIFCLGSTRRSLDHVHRPSAALCVATRASSVGPKVCHDLLRIFRRNLPSIKQAHGLAAIWCVRHHIFPMGILVGWRTDQCHCRRAYTHVSTSPAVWKKRTYVSSQGRS